MVIKLSVSKSFHDAFCFYWLYITNLDHRILEYVCPYAEEGSHKSRNILAPKFKFFIQTKLETLELL